MGRAPAEPAYRPGQPAGQPPRPLPARRQTAGFPRGDTALLVFIPLPDGASLAALRVLAQRCEPLFFQRLRVEQQIGYVVSCRYQRVADRDGLLMALQSPDRRAVELLRCCKTFLRQLPPLDEAAFRPLQQPGRTGPRPDAARGAGAGRPASEVCFTGADGAGG